MGDADNELATSDRDEPDGLSIAERAYVRRAVEAAVWAVPAVNFELMRSLMAPDGGTSFVYWSGMLDWRNQTLTPNPDLIYYMAFLNPGADGPLVLEIPRGDEVNVLNGNVCTVWQVPLEDVGKYGADKGEGGRYLILPPGYDGDVPDGYFVLRSDTQRVYALLRSVLPEATQAAVDAGLEYCSRIRIYPLAEAADPSPTQRRDLKGQVVDSRIPWNDRFWETLDQVVQAEPWLERDRPFSEILSFLGIRRGEPFAPTARQWELLQLAITEAHTFIRDTFQNEIPFYDGTHWFIPAHKDFLEGQQDNWSNSQVYPYTDRAVTYHMAFIGLKRLGVGQFYLVAARDADGRLLDSGRSYRLTVPAGVPVTQYWSVTMYDGEDHTFIRGNTKYSVSSLTPGLAVNDDGTVDVYVGPRATAGHEANWIETGKSTSFELMFRFYGVGPEVLSKQWQLIDLENLTQTDGSNR
jgi:hypothetical protein